jgi:Holliday junction DNA helicase RuvB
MMKEGDLELLHEIAQFEDSQNMDELRMGWSWRHVRVWPATLNRLFKDGYLENVFRSNSYTGYRLSELGSAAIANDKEKSTETPRDSKKAFPDDLFGVIEGYEDIKALVRQVLNSEKPVHILFTGVPSSAKTMFLLELARCGAPYVLGSQSTKAGIADLLFDTEPEILLVDEIDRIGTKDIAVLLSLTQTGIVSETKMGKRREISLKTKVFAASNTLKMAPELLSRFMVLRFKPYSREDFLVVASNLLSKRENVDGELAAYIAESVWSRSQRFPDPREAVRVARLAETREEVDRLQQVVMRYSDAG